MPDDVNAATHRLWTNPGAGAGSPSLIRLAEEALTLAEVPGPDLEGVIGGIEDGEPVAGYVIPLGSIRGASGDEDGNVLSVAFSTGPSKTESRSIAFAGRADRDEFVAALAEALGPGWALRQTPVSRWKAGFWTLGPTAVAALLTWGLHAEAARIAQGKPPLNWGKGRFRLPAAVVHWVEQQAGPTVLLVAGGLLVAAGMVLFLCAMSTPPRTIAVEYDEAS
jgi:hypothetical protein